MDADRLPERPRLEDELHHFRVKTLYGQVLSRHTPEGNKPFVSLKQQFERPDGIRLSQDFVIDCNRLLQVSERVGQHLADWDRRRGLFDRLATRMTEAVGRTLAPQPIAKFRHPERHSELKVELFARETADGTRPFVKLSQTLKRQDGSERTQAFLINVRRLGEVIDQVKPVVQAQERKEELKRQEQEKVQWWPVVRIVETLETGAVVRVTGCFRSRDEAELRSRGSPSFVFPEPSPRELAAAERLVVAGGESKAIDARIRDAKLMEEYHKRHTRPDLTHASLTPELRQGIRLVKSKSHGDTEARVIRFTDEHGERQERVLLTRPVRQDDGTTREVTTEHTRDDLPAMIRGLLYRPRKPSPEAAKQPAASKLSAPSPSTSDRQTTPLERPHIAVGVWCGSEPPKEGQTVAWNPIVRWTQEPGEGWRSTVRGAKVTPVVGPTTKPPSDTRLFAVVGRGEHDEVYRVIGWTRDKSLALAKARALDLARLAESQRQLESVRSQDQDPSQQPVRSVKLRPSL